MKNGDMRHGAGAAAIRRVSRLASAVVLAMGLASPSLSAAPIPWKLPTYTLVARGMDLRTDALTYDEAADVLLRHFGVGSDEASALGHFGNGSDEASALGHFGVSEGGDE